MFFLLVIIYTINGDSAVGTDCTPNIYLAARILDDGKLTFSPRDAPFMFIWDLRTPKGIETVRINNWSQQINQRPAGD